MPEDKHVWRCPNGHVLGVVERNGSHVRQLQLFRNAVWEEYAPFQQDVVATIIGSVTEVRCSLCGSTSTWVPGQEYIDELIRRRKQKVITFEESERMFYE
jgi:hypothetical protein